MKKIFSLLLALTCMVGMWAEVVTYDFSAAANLPSGFSSRTNTSAATTETEFTMANGAKFSVVAQNSVYWYNSQTLLFGKTVKNQTSLANTSYLKFPGKSGYKMSKIKVYVNTGAATPELNVFDATYTAVSTAQTLVAGGNKEFTITSPAANTPYYITTPSGSTSGKNFQFTKIEVTYVEDGDTRTATSLSWGVTSAIARMGQAFDAPTLTKDPVDLVGVVYSSSDESVAEINESTGAITLKKAGVTDITASFEGDATYKPSSATYKLTIKGAANAEEWVKITSTPDTWEGEYLLLAEANGTYYCFNGLGTTGNEYMAGVELDANEYTVNGNTINTLFPEGEKPSIFVSNTATAGRYNVKGIANSYVGGTSGGASLTTNQSNWVFEFNDGGDVWMRVYAASMDRAVFMQITSGGNANFKHYATSNRGKDGYYNTYIYKKKVASLNVTTAQYATYYNATEAYVMPANLEGITVEGIDGDALTLETRYKAGDVVPAGEALILHGAATTYTLYAGITSEEKVAANMLKGTSTAEEETTGGAPYYRLSQHEGQVGFYYGAADGGEFKPGANKAYLALNGAGAPARFIFGQQDVPTELQNVSAEAVSRKVVIDGRLYIVRDGNMFDLNGRLVK